MVFVGILLLRMIDIAATVAALMTWVSHCRYRWEQKTIVQYMDVSQSRTLNKLVNWLRLPIVFHSHQLRPPTVTYPGRQTTAFTDHLDVSTHARIGRSQDSHHPVCFAKRAHKRDKRPVSFVSSGLPLPPWYCAIIPGWDSSADIKCRVTQSSPL